jgi:hypothetical protein
MIGEINVFGIFLPALLCLMLVALVIHMVLWRIIQLIPWYRVVWHPSLLELATYILVLGVVIRVSQHLVS